MGDEVEVDFHQLFARLWSVTLLSRPPSSRYGLLGPSPTPSWLNRTYRPFRLCVGKVQTRAHDQAAADPWWPALSSAANAVGADCRSGAAGTDGHFVPQRRLRLQSGCTRVMIAHPLSAVQTVQERSTTSRYDANLAAGGDQVTISGRGTQPSGDPADDLSVSPETGPTRVVEFGRDIYQCSGVRHAREAV